MLKTILEARGIVAKGQATLYSGSLQICTLYNNLVKTGHVSHNYFNRLWGLSADLLKTSGAQLVNEMSDLTITRQQPTKIFIGGLSPNTTDAHIHQYFTFQDLFRRPNIHHQDRHCTILTLIVELIIKSTLFDNKPILNTQLFPLGEEIPAWGSHLKDD